MSDIPNWLRGVRPQLNRVTNDGPHHYWALSVYGHLGSNYDLRIRVNGDSAVDGTPIDDFRFYTCEDDGCSSEWKEVVTFDQMHRDEQNIEQMTCCHFDYEHYSKECPDVEPAIKKYVETHHMVHGDSAIWEVRQLLVRHWHALTLIVAIGP